MTVEQNDHDEACMHTFFANTQCTYFVHTSSLYRIMTGREAPNADAVNLPLLNYYYHDNEASKCDLESWIK